MASKNKLQMIVKVVLAFILLSTLLVDSVLAKEERYNMSYLYFGNTETFINAVHDTDGALNAIAPSYFDLNSDGTLKEKVDPIFVKEMKKIGVKVIPFISNHWNRELGRTALANRESLVAEIVTAINKYNLDGINIDLENLTEVDRGNYIEFVKLLYNSLPSDKEISIAVAPNPWGTSRGWQGSYDYKELAKYCDYLMIMTYDESYHGSAPGPVASIDFVEDSIQYALTQVDSKKIVLGIPFYGRYWKDGSAIGGAGIPNNKVEKFIEEYDGIVYFDEQEKSPYVKFTVKSGDVYPKVSGKTLFPGNYTIWYENKESIKTKLGLVEKYDLLGTGSWSLSNATKDTWDYYSLYLNGGIFSDIAGHWAEEDILTMAKNGWMVGTSDDGFSPNMTLTRAQAVVVLVRALGLGMNSADSEESNFEDVSDNYWAKSEIEIAYQHGIIEGRQAGYFAPNEPINRAEIAVILARIYYSKEDIDSIVPTENNFVDVSNNHWAISEITLLNKEGIFEGYSDGKFYSKNKLSRAEMAALMSRINSL